MSCLECGQQLEANKYWTCDKCDKKYIDLYEKSERKGETNEN
jgi:ribosomal protein L37AE/L43A